METEEYQKAKKEYLDKRHEKKGTELKELEKKWTEFEAIGKEFGIEENKALSTYIKRRFTSYYAKLDRTPTEDFKGVILGWDITDYGAQREYDNAKKLYSKNPHKAINEGYTDDDGNPLYRKPDFKKGNPIIPKEAIEINALVIAKTKDDENWKEASLKFNHKFLGKEMPQYSLVKFKAILNKQKSNEQQYFLSAMDTTNFEVERELKDDEVYKLFENLFKKNEAKIGQLKTYYDNLENRNAQVLIKGDVSDLVFTDGNKKNMLILNAEEDENDLITPSTTVLCDKSIDLPFDENAQNIIAIGRLWQGEGDEINMTATSIFCPSRYRIKDKPEEIKEESEPKEETKTEENPKEKTEEKVEEKIEDNIPKSFDLDE